MGSDPLDLFTAEATLDPHPVQARLRAESPVHHHPSLDAWTIARHRDVVEVMRDARRFSSELGMGELMAGRIRPDDPVRPTADFAGAVRVEFGGIRGAG